MVQCGCQGTFLVLDSSLLKFLSEVLVNLQLWERFTVALRHDKERVKDGRLCEFCLEHGDGDSNGSGRFVMSHT